MNGYKKSTIFLVIGSFTLATVLLIGAGLSATERDKPKDELAEKNKIPVKKEETKKKKAVKAPVIFVPTDKVSANQAVAFPTDI